MNIHINLLLFIFVVVVVFFCTSIIKLALFSAFLFGATYYRVNKYWLNRLFFVCVNNNNNNKAKRVYKQTNKHKNKKNIKNEFRL